MGRAPPLTRKKVKGKNMPGHLTTMGKQKFPKINDSLHLVAVRMNEELEDLLLIEKGCMQGADVRKIQDITSLLLTIRKTAPSLEEKVENDEVSWTKAIEAPDPPAEDIGIDFKIIGE